MPPTLTPPLSQPFQVLVGPDGGIDVRSANVLSYVQLATLNRFAGGHRLDYVELIYSLAEAQQHLVNISTPFDFSRRVQVRLAQPTGTPTVCVFSGELAIESIKIDRSGEFCHLIARVEPWHFGNPLLGPHMLNVDGVTLMVPDLPIAFNPMIDGLICGNMSNATDTAHDNMALWIDPESVRTAPARTVQNQTASEWDLANAVHSLCWTCNPFEDLIYNPTLTELQTAIVSPPELRNVQLKRGKRLPELLDELLPPLGYNWCLDVIADPLDTTTSNGMPDPRYINKIRVFALGSGTQLQLYSQAPPTIPGQTPQTLDLTQTNVSDLEMTWNIADLANVIVGQGSFREVEATFELYRAWAEADDALGPDDLRKTEETTADDPNEESQYKAKPNVWRKWVLNEAGDYCSTRGTIAPIPSTPFQFGWGKFPVNAISGPGIRGSGAFIVTGDATQNIGVGDEIEVSGSSGNDGTYTVRSLSLAAGNTTIGVFESIPENSATGNVLCGLLGWNTLVKRRRFHHCLTWGADLERRDVFVQYRDPSVPYDTSPGAWKALNEEQWSNIGFHVLEKECGILFTGATPPPDLMAIDDPTLGGTRGAARLRITATVRGDERLEATAARQSASPNLNSIQRFVDLSDRFHRREVQVFGPYASALLSEPYGSDRIDDSTNLQTFVSALQAVEQGSRITAEVQLWGVSTQYSIGNLVTKVQGREISFNRNSSLQTPLYPQITALHYDRPRQRTMLKIEMFDFTPAQIKKMSF